MLLGTNTGEGMKKIFINVNLSLIACTVSTLVLLILTTYLNLASSYRIEVRYLVWLAIFMLILSLYWLVFANMKEAPKGGDEFYKTKDNIVAKVAYFFTIGISSIALMIISGLVGSVRHGNELLGLPPIFWIGFKAAIFALLCLSNIGLLIGRLIVWLKFR